MTFQGGTRPMCSEHFGALIGLDAEWRAQGASENELNMMAFDWEDVPMVPCAGECGPINTPEPVLLEEIETHQVIRDHLGRTGKLCKDTATLPRQGGIRTRNPPMRRVGSSVCGS